MTIHLLDTLIFVKMHDIYIGDIPCPNVLIECLGVREHPLHISDIGDVPCPDVLVE